MIRFDVFELNFEERELRKRGTRVPLQKKPFRILEILVRHPGMLVSRQELAKELWPDLHVEFEHCLNSAMNSLRQALEDTPKGSRYIETRSGLGYRFIAQIEEVERTNGVSSAKTVKAAAPSDYLRGRFFLNKMTDDGIQRAIGSFHSVLDERPGYAPAQAGLADCYCQLALTGSTCAKEVGGTAREFATAALQSDPLSPEAHISMGRVRMIFDWDWKKAGDDLGRAQELDPALTESNRARAFLFAARSRGDDGLNEIDRAQELDPLSVPIGFERAWILYLTGRFEEAVRQAWRVLTLEPGFAPAQMVLGLAYQQLGSIDESVVELENACVCSGRHPAAVASLGHVYAVAGLADKAKCLLGELAEPAKRQNLSSYWLAVVYTGLGVRQMAMGALRDAFVKREPLLLWAGTDPRLATLRGEGEFKALCRDLEVI